jgi:release factor glutamine methyltransferase
LGVELEVAPGVLVPREETELLGRAAVEILQSTSSPRFAIDMCCGSGNLACAVARAVDGLTVWACDLTEESVALAARNAQRLGLEERVVVRQGDLFDALKPGELHEAADLVMCNPPYISTGRLAGDRSYLLDQEPREAFDGGPYGLSIHQRVLRDAPAFLKIGGRLAMEFGEGQDRQLASLLKRSRAYDEIEFRRDTEGRPRVLVARRCA